MPKEIKTVVVSVRSERQMPGAESYGGVLMRLDVLERVGAMEFDSLVDTTGRGIPQAYVDLVRETASNALARDPRNPLEHMGFRITLLDLYVHIVDSRAAAYRMTCEQAIADGLRVFLGEGKDGIAR